MYSIGGTVYYTVKAILYTGKWLIIMICVFVKVCMTWIKHFKIFFFRWSFSHLFRLSRFPDIFTFFLHINRALPQGMPYAVYDVRFREHRWVTNLENPSLSFRPSHLTPSSLSYATRVSQASFFMSILLPLNFPIQIRRSIFEIYHVSPEHASYASYYALAREKLCKRRLNNLPPLLTVTPLAPCSSSIFFQIFDNNYALFIIIWT